MKHIIHFEYEQDGPGDDSIKNAFIELTDEDGTDRAPLDVRKVTVFLLLMDQFLCLLNTQPKPTSHVQAPHNN